MSIKIHNCFLVLFVLLLVMAVRDLSIALIFGQVASEFVLHGITACALSAVAIALYIHIVLGSKVPSSLVLSGTGLSLLALLFSVRRFVVTYGIGTLESHEKLSSILRNTVPLYVVLPVAVLVYLFLQLLAKNKIE